MPWRYVLRHPLGTTLAWDCLLVSCRALGFWRLGSLVVSLALALACGGVVRVGVGVRGGLGVFGVARVGSLIPSLAAVIGIELYSMRHLDDGHLACLNEVSSEISSGISMPAALSLSAICSKNKNVFTIAPTHHFQRTLHEGTISPVALP